MVYNYVVVQNKTTGMDAIKLMDEPFANIIFTYGKINMATDEAGGIININFEYEILDKGNKEFGNMVPFETYIGGLLEHILHNEIDKETQKLN